MITTYTKDYCPYCHKAKALLDSLNVEYQDIDVTHDPDTLAQASEKSGITTVPQIFVNGQFIGDCSQIHSLHQEGKLLDILKG